MSTSRRTSKIPEKEWEARKCRIIELYLDGGLQLAGPKGVIQTMENEGFAATGAQYERQFRIWKVRKNMKRHEWARILQKQRQGGDFTSTIPENMTMPPTRLERARRRYAHIIPQVEELVSHPSDDAAQENTEPPMPTGDIRPPVENPTSESTMTITEPGNRAINTVPSFDNWLLNADQSMPSHENPGILSSRIGFADPLNKFNIWPPELGENDVDWRTLFDWTPGQLINVTESQCGVVSPRSAIDITPEWMECIRPSAVSSPYPHGALNSSIFVLQKNEGKLPSTVITSRLIEDIYKKARTTLGHGRERGAFGLTNRFLTAIKETTPTTLRSMHGVKNSPATQILALGYLLSTETFFGEEVVELQNDISIDVATEVRPYSRVITSVINGFTGLKNIPAAGVLRFLTRHQATQASMIQLLGSNTGPVARSLAENLFRAAIEDDNVDIVKFLLDHNKMVDANDTVCHLNGSRYTPLEIAAMKQSFGVLRLLVRRNVDVNKSFPECAGSNAFWLLIRSTDAKSTLDDRFLNLTDAFLEAGAIIFVDTVSWVLKDFVDTRLAIRLIQNAASQSPQKLILENFLEDILKNLDRKHAIKMMTLIIEKCNGVNVNLCLDPYLKHIDCALHEAIKLGYEELVKTLIPYASSPGEILQIAKRAGNQAITDLILRNHPTCDEGAGEIEYLLAALESSDKDCLLMLEERGVIERLNPYELDQALIAALESENLQFATKILDFDPDFYCLDTAYYDTLHGKRLYGEYPSATSAFAAALKHNFDEMAWKLLAVSLGGIRHIRTNVAMEALHSAVLTRKPDFVRAILEFGVYFTASDSGSNVEQAAIKWGDSSIINDLCQGGVFRPDPPRHLLKFATEGGQTDLVWGILGHYPKDKLSVAAEVAIECNNLMLLHELIVCDDLLDNEALLRQVAKHNPSLVRPLLERYRKAYPQGRAGYGWNTIVDAIDGYPGSSKMLDIFFDFGLMAGDNLTRHTRHTRHARPADPVSGMLVRHGTLLTLAIGNVKYVHGVKHPKECLIKRLLNAGSDVNAIIPVDDWDGGTKSTALLQAIQTENRAIVQLLVQRGAEVNKPARLGIWRTPLQEAAALNNLEMVRLLLEKGADVNALPAKLCGATALQFAAIHGNCDMAMTLIEHGAKLDVAPSMGPPGRWPLEGAAENGRIDMIQLLWDANSGPFDDQQCRKAMRLAERQGHLGCRDMIIELMAKSSIEY